MEKFGDPSNRAELDRLKELLKEKERQLEAQHRSEAFVDALLENIPDMIFVKDAQSLKFIRFNRAGVELLGFSREDLMGKSDYDFFPKAEADFFTSKDRAVIETGKLMDIPQETIHTRTKGRRVLHTRKIPIYDRNGSPVYLLGISEDITELTQAKEEAASVFRSREDILSIISHDLRTPLSSILLATTMLMKRSRNLDDSLKKFLERIERASHVMESLIEDILDLGQIERGMFQIESASEDIAALLNEICEMFRPQAAEKSIRLNLEMSVPACTVSMDRRRFAQVLMNLISNAIKFTPESGKVTVRLDRCEEDSASVQIRDTGPGIPADQVNQIFQPYWKMGRGGKGVGLGLAIAKGIVESHGGTIWVQSELEVGTTMNVRLPGSIKRAA